MIDVQQLRKEAENGDAEAQFLLGVHYHDGLEVGHGVLDLAPIVEAGAADHLVRHALAHERLLDHLGSLDENRPFLVCQPVDHGVRIGFLDLGQSDHQVGADRQLSGINILR